MKKSMVLISGEKLNLVLPDKTKHFEKCLRWINDSRVTPYLLRGLFPVSRKMEEEWFDRINGDEKNLVMIIELKEGRPIGTIGFHQINHLSRTAAMGIMIGETEEWGNGYATEAERLMCDYGFDTIGLNRISAQIFSENTASRKAAAKNGFREEGVLRQALYKNGRYYDLILIAILRSEWEKK